MTTILWLLGGMAAAYALFKGAAPDVSKEAPADANALLGTVLAPSFVDPVELGRMMNVFIATAANQPTEVRITRLMLYALATGLKRAMLLKGAQPNPQELLAIAYAPANWRDADPVASVSPDVARAVSDALQGSMTSVPALNTYAQAIAQAASNEQLSNENRARMLAALLAIRAKAIMLIHGATFGQLVYASVARMPTSGQFGKYLADLNQNPAQGKASILAYPVQS
jgi:hypothetical protein